MTIDLTVRGADQLAATSHALADRLRQGLDLDAGEEVLGYITHPAGTPAGRASGLRAESTPLGFALIATGPEPFVQRFLTDPLDTRAEAVVENYAQQLEELLTTIKGA